METLEIRNIRLDGGTQPRAGLDDKTVGDYMQEVRDGATFPPVVVYYDGANYWLADGFHRVSAYRFAGKQRIPAEIRQGTLRDAQLYAVGANATHGLRRSRDDKRRAVLMMLDDAEWCQLGNREIARYCNVSHTFVANVRDELSGNVASNGEKPEIGNVASNDEKPEIGNVATLTAVLRAELEQEYKTAEPAVIAVIARALSSNRSRCLWLESLVYRKMATPITADSVRVALISLAQEMQANVPQNGNGQETAVKVPAVFALVDAIKRLHPADVNAIRRRNQMEIERVDLHPDIDKLQELKRYYQTMEEIICASRPN